jgi:hypothetical protein
MRPGSLHRKKNHEARFSTYPMLKDETKKKNFKKGTKAKKKKANKRIRTKSNIKI